MKKQQSRFWRAFERLSGGAVRWEWRNELGDEFDDAWPFLRPEPGSAETYPCTNVAGCGLPHRVEPHGRGHWLALCDPDEGCAPIMVKAEDLILFAADTAKLCRSIAEAIGLDTPTSRPRISARAELVGTWGAARSDAYLMFPADNARMAREVERLFNSQNLPFILFTPTGEHSSPEVESALRRQSCIHLPLDRALVFDNAGRFTVTNCVQASLDQFVQGLVRNNGLAKTVDRIDRNIDLIAKDKFELRNAVTKLEKMRGEGLFAFAAKIDPETLQQFLMIVAAGTVAKASRELGMSDSTLRSKVDGWKQRGKRYAALAEFVRWRKSIKGQAGMELAKEIASGGGRDVDYQGLLRDILGELAEFNEENWEERSEELAGLLKSQLS